MCDNCPFAKSGKGRHLRRTLRASHWQKILAALRLDGYFLCHKTTFETGDGTNLLCAGSLQWQEEHLKRPGLIPMLLTARPEYMVPVFREAQNLDDREKREQMESAFK